MKETGWAAFAVLLLALCAVPGHGRRHVFDASVPYGVVGRVEGTESLAYMRELGVGWARVGVKWGDVEPGVSTSRWGDVQRRFAEVRREYRGLGLIVTLRAVSDWGCEYPPGADRHASAPPVDLGRYAAWVRKMAYYGRRVVSVWQIENEPDASYWWAGTAEEYAEMLGVAYAAVKQVDPHALVMLGGLTSEIVYEQAPGLERVAGLCEGSYDIADLHLYHDAESIPARVAFLRGLIPDDVPIWATEVGGPDPLIEPHSEQRQAEEVWARVDACREAGVEVMLWHSLIDLPWASERFRNMGLVTDDGRKKAAFYAYQEATE